MSKETIAIIGLLLIIWLILFFDNCSAPPMRKSAQGWNTPDTMVCIPITRLRMVLDTAIITKLKLDDCVGAE
jgi:hypothetical protein